MMTPFAQWLCYALDLSLLVVHASRGWSRRPSKCSAPVRAVLAASSRSARSRSRFPLSLLTT